MNKKKSFILAGLVFALLCIICVTYVIFMLVGKKDVERIIKVLSFTGEPVISREQVGELDACEGMVLESGDRVFLNAGSTMVILMDDDKYVYAEDNSQIRVIAEGTVNESKSVIELESGVITCDVQNKLRNKSTYEVTTPNTAFAIKGTVVTIECRDGAFWREREGGFVPLGGYTSYNSVTNVTMWNGEVIVKLLKPRGMAESESISVVAGEQAIIGSNDTQTMIIAKGSEENPAEGWNLSARTIENIKAIEANKGKIVVPDAVLNMHSEEPTTYRIDYYVNRENGVTKFVTQTVNAGEKLKLPLLKPDEDGKWDVAQDAIGQPVQYDLLILWK